MPDEAMTPTEARVLAGLRGRGAEVLRTIAVLPMRRSPGQQPIDIPRGGERDG
jgi:hypothetical protein